MRTRLSLLAVGALLLCGSAFAQRIRVVHASPDAPAVDILVDGQPGLTGIPFGDYSDYVTLPAGQHQFTVNVAGTATQVAQLTATLNTGVDYTVIAQGFAGGKTPALSLNVLIDNNSLPGDGSSKVRVVHAAPSAPTVDVYVTRPYLALKGQTATLTGVPFGAASGYLPAPAGVQLAARVTPTGTTTVAIDAPHLVLGNNQVRTVIAIDSKGGGAPFSLLVVADRN